MTEQGQKELGKTLWNIADQLRGAMNADDFRDYMLSFLFLRYLSDNYELAAKKELGSDYPKLKGDASTGDETKAGGTTPLAVWYEQNKKDTPAFEKQMRRKVHYVIRPEYLWGSIVHLARTQNDKLLDTLQNGFKYIEEESFSSNFQGPFSEINLASDKLGRKYADRNAKLCSIISEIARGMALFSTDVGIGKIFGMEKNITTYNLARMNMLLHGVKDTEFEIYHGDTLTNDWDSLRETNPRKKPQFDAVVANPPFSYRWEPGDAMSDMRFKNHGVAPKSAADFAFLLHGLHYLKDDGVMAIILPHGVLFRGGQEAKIREKLLNDGHIDTVIGLPANLFYSTGIPVCILVLKKCKKPDDVLFINAAEQFVKGKRQNRLEEEHIEKIIATYRKRPKQIERYARRVEMKEIAENDFNLNISRYVSTAQQESEIDLAATHSKLVEIEKAIHQATTKHNDFLRELGLSPLPSHGPSSKE